MMLKPFLRIIQDSNQILELTKIKELEQMQKLQPLSFVGLHCWLKKNKRCFRGNKNRSAIFLFQEALQFSAEGLAVVLSAHGKLVNLALIS